jgi:hypothetical protein
MPIFSLTSAIASCSSADMQYLLHILRPDIDSRYLSPAHNYQCTPLPQECNSYAHNQILRLPCYLIPSTRARLFTEICQPQDLKFARCLHINHVPYE